MVMLNGFWARFLSDQDGAVSVDFVVLTSAIFMMGLTAVSSFSGAANDLANDISAEMEGITLP